MQFRSCNCKYPCEGCSPRVTGGYGIPDRGYESSGFTGIWGTYVHAVLLVLFFAGCMLQVCLAKHHQGDNGKREELAKDVSGTKDLVDYRAGVNYVCLLREMLAERAYMSSLPASLALGQEGAPKQAQKLEAKA